jgi:hypothetical protein
VQEKLLTFEGKNDRGIFTYLIDAERSHLEKTASEYHPTVAAYINSAKPIPGKMQVLLTALGAGEWWGSNVNGDFFPEEALAHEGPDYGYKTFETSAKVYKHHVNKDPARSYGDVLLSVYNPTYHRVELVVAVDLGSGKDIADRIENGDYPDWSMGCKVPYDVCSICGNRAPTRAQYCEHAKYYLNKIWPATGQQVYVINTRPKFHDISQVLIGADRIAKTLMKVASQKSFYDVSSAYAAEKRAESGLWVPRGFSKVSGVKKAVDKKATMVKEVPAEPPASADAVKDLIEAIKETKARELPLPKPVLNELGEMPLKNSLTTLGLLGILPKPQEFQRIVLISVGRRDLADELDQENLCFDPLDGRPNEKHHHMVGMEPSFFDERAFSLIKPFMAERSYASPHLGRRLTVIIKRASVESPNFLSARDRKGERKPFGIAPVLLGVAGLYAAFAGKAAKAAPQNIDNLLLKHPGVAAAVGLSLVTTAKALFGDSTKGHYSKDMDVKTDVWSRIDRLKAKPFEKQGGFTLTPANRLFIGAPSAYIASDVLQKRIEQNPYAEEGMISKFIRKNPDIITGALAADAYLSMGGKGSVISKGIGVVKDYFLKAVKNIADFVPTRAPQDFFKKADAVDFLTSSVIYPLAFGTKNLPARVVGGLIDQAALDVGSKYLTRKAQSKQPDSFGKAAGLNLWDVLFY